MANTPEISSFLYEQRLEGLAETTRNSYAWVLRSYPGSLTPPDLNEAKDYVASLQDRGRAAATVIVRIRALKRYSAWWAADNEANDPLHKLKYPRQTEPLPGPIVDDELIDQALTALSRWSEHRNNARDHALVTLLKYTGMRRSEIARMRVEHVDFHANTIDIPLAKGNRSRTVPLHPTLARSLRRWIRQRSTRPHGDRPWLWPGLGGLAMRPDSISGILDSVSRRCGLPRPLRTHQFRRRLASEWIRRGGSDPELMLIAGWRSPAMPARYRQEHSAELAADQYARLFQEQPTRVLGTHTIGGKTISIVR